MSTKTKQLLIKFIIYVILGFAAAFFWHEMKST